MQYILLIILLLVVIVFFAIPVRSKKVKFDEKAQAIKVYEEEKAYLDKKLADTFIDSAAHQSLLTELDQKTALAMSEISKKTFSYQKTHIGLFVALFVTIGMGFLFYFTFYHGTVQQWQNFQSKYRNQIALGLSDSSQINLFSKEELPTYCFSLQRKILKGYQQRNKTQFTNLALCYVKSGIISLANDAVEQGLSLDRDDPELNFLAAEVQMMDSGQLSSQSIKGLLHTLKDDPNHFGSLWLLGLDSYQKGDFDHAEVLLNRIKSSKIDNLEISAIIDKMLLQIQQQKNQSTTSKKTDQPTDNSQREINLNIHFDSKLIAPLQPPKTVFIIVKSVEGQIINVNKIDVHDFSQPIAFLVTDNNPSMMKNASLNQFKEATVQARLSLTGDPMSSEGDLTSKLIQVSLDKAKTIDVNIDQKVTETK